MNLVEKLLALDENELKKERTKEYESKNLKRLIGEGTIVLRKVRERKIMENSLGSIDKKGNPNMANMHDTQLLIVLDGVKEPNLKDERLVEHFGVATPKDLAELLFDGEIADISDAITDFDTEDDDEEETEEAVKN